MGSYHLEDSGQECLGSLSDEGGGSLTAGLRQSQHRLGLRRLPRIGRRCHARLSGCGKLRGRLAASDRLGESAALLERGPISSAQRSRSLAPKGSTGL
jgi:transposase